MTDSAARDKTRDSSSSLNIDVKQRNDVKAGMVEVTVRVDNKAEGKTFVATSPRELAFERK